MEFLVTSLPGLRHISKREGSYAKSMEFLHEWKKYIVVCLRNLVLDPFLFIVYINDLPFCQESSQVTMYADDTSISFTANSVDDLNMTLNKELDSLRKWLQGNKLSLNVLRTQAMVIGSHPNSPNLKKISTKLVEPPSFSIGGSEVEMVDNVKYFRGAD